MGLFRKSKKKTNDDAFVVMVCGPIANVPDWRERMESLDVLIDGVKDVLVVGAHRNGYRYNGLNGVALSVHDAMRCDAVLMMQGWENAKGCQYEFQIALSRGIAILFEMPDGAIEAYQKL